MAKKPVKIDDCQRTLDLRAPDGNNGSMTIHTPDMLMRANRRFYQQSRAYDVSLEVVPSTTSARSYHLYTLSNAWWVKRSIEMAKGVYLAATKNERALLAESGQNATYGDFIIECNSGAGGNFSNLHQYLPATSGDNIDDAEVATDETIYESPRTGTRLKDDDGNEMGFTVLAEDKAGSGVFNIFTEYLLSRKIDPPTDSRAGPYADLEVIDEDAIAALKGLGDETPWDADAFPNPFVLQDVIHCDSDSDVNNNACQSRTFTAPLGIVLVKKYDSDDGSTEQNILTTDKFLLRVRKGTYKGVHAPAYRAMNGVLGS